MKTPSNEEGKILDPIGIAHAMCHERLATITSRIAINIKVKHRATVTRRIMIIIKTYGSVALARLDQMPNTRETNLLTETSNRKRSIWDQTPWRV